MTTPTMVTEALKALGRKVSYSKHRDDGRRDGLRGIYHIWKIGTGPSAKRFSIFIEAGRIFRADVAEIVADARRRIVA